MGCACFECVCINNQIIEARSYPEVLVNLEFAMFFRLASNSKAISLFLPPKCWDYKYRLLYQSFCLLSQHKLNVGLLSIVVHQNYCDYSSYIETHSYHLPIKSTYSRHQQNAFLGIGIYSVSSDVYQQYVDNDVPHIGNFITDVKGIDMLVILDK